ncbi:MAG: tripartite tricarboxylate transporter substrate binding protein [Pseudomonadota bacterium]
MFQRCLAAVAAAAFFTAGTGVAMADWPEKPIRVVVPFNPGGTSDQMARAFQAAIQENDLVGQPINIINVGGHYSIGSRQVLEAEADGHTFLVLHVALMGGEATGAMDFGFRDFAPVAATGEFCVLPMVRKDSGIDSLGELLQAAAAEPDTLIFGANIGAINHMAGIMLQNAEPGAAFRFVQIGGGTANFTALTGAQTNTTVLSGAEVINFTQLPDGSDNPEAQIKPLAYTGPERLAQLPDIPTAKELGYDVEFCIQNWWFAPKDTPPEAVAAMAEVLAAASQSDSIVEWRDTKAFADVFLSGDDFAKALDATWERIEPVALQAKGN